MIKAVVRGVELLLPKTCQRSNNIYVNHYMCNYLQINIFLHISIAWKVHSIKFPLKLILQLKFLKVFFQGSN